MSRAKRRQPLTRERVLLAAVQLADRYGLGQLSMRTLGRELGVEAMSLYNHVANKDDLLDGMIDCVFGEVGLPPGGSDWKTAIRERARAARAALSRNPWAIGLMESRRQPGPATLQHHEAVIGCLRQAGFSIERRLTPTPCWIATSTDSRSTSKHCRSRQRRMLPR